MKKLTIFFYFFIICLSAISQNIKCTLGFSYEISRQKSWGYGKPVVISVAPNTDAYLKLKPFDIIDSVEGKSTESLTEKELTDNLQNVGKDRVSLSVYNIGTGSRLIDLIKDCKQSNSLNEYDLSLANSFYSLEDMLSFRFDCPFQTTANQNFDLSRYKTFNFGPIDKNNLNLEIEINDEISKELYKKGLTLDRNKPDVIIYTYYSYGNNPAYDASNKSVNTNNYRYDSETDMLESLPFFQPGTDKRKAPYILTLGIKFTDRMHTDSTKILWQCESRELLTGPYSLQSYAKINIPFMLAQYPYLINGSRATFLLKKYRYNYTGIDYDLNNLNHIIDVDMFSPAYQAGVRPDDYIEEINGIKLKSNPDDVSEDYKNFIYKTLDKRDSSSIYTDSNGFNKCMLWNKNLYDGISVLFRDSKYPTPFSYIFYFEPYINSLTRNGNKILFKLKRGKKNDYLYINPKILMINTIECIK